MKEIKDNKIKVAIYCRVASKDQLAIEKQERRIRAYCEAKGYKVYNVYIDNGISGRTTKNRPAFQQMMKDMRNKKFNQIMADTLDRISRNVIDFENFFNEIKKYNCGLEFVLEKFDTTTPSGRMIMKILEVFAQFEEEHKNV